MKPRCSTLSLKSCEGERERERKSEGEHHESLIGHGATDHLHCQSWHDNHAAALWLCGLTWTHMGLGSRRLAPYLG